MGLLGAALAGFGGGARGYEAAMQRHDAENAKAQQHQWDLDKEKRIEEAAIRSEGRASTNAAKERQAALDFNTDPNTVKRVAQADIDKQNEKDKYNDGRFDTTLAQKTREYNATHPYEEEKTLAEIETQKAHGDYYRSAAAQKYDTSGITDKNVKAQYEIMLKALDRKQKQMDALDEKESIKPGSGYASPAERMSMLKEIKELSESINGVESSLTGMESPMSDALQSSVGAGDSWNIEASLNKDTPTGKNIPKNTEQRAQADADKKPGILSRAWSVLNTDKAEAAKENAERRKKIDDTVKTVAGVLNPKQQEWFDSLSKQDQERFNNLPRRDKIAALNAAGV